MTEDAPAPLSWETLDSEVAYTCPGFDVVNEAVRLPDGTETDFDYLAEGESVVVLPFTADGDVVVIEEWRQAVDRVNFGLPAGSMEGADADVETAARRELREETGYEADSVEHLASYEPANGFADAVFHYVVAEGCTPTASQDLDFNESIRVDTTPFDALREQVAAGDLRDGRTALAITQYLLDPDTGPEAR